LTGKSPTIRCSNGAARGGGTFHFNLSFVNLSFDLQPTWDDVP